MPAMKASPPARVRLSVSIVLHDGCLEMLQRVLHSLYRSAEVARESADIDQVLVEVLDNTPDRDFRSRAAALVLAWPRNEFFQVIYRELSDNRGFGAGHNIAIHNADSEFHLVLNPDAELTESALHNGLASLRADPGVALVSPRVVGPDGSQEFLCKRYPSVLVLLLRAFAPEVIRRLFRKALNRYEMRDICSGDRAADVPLASGCFMLARTADLQGIGGFNDDYFLYFEDFDLSIRLAHRGRLVFNPSVQIIHHGGYAASKGMQHVKYFVRSGITFFRQHGWRWI